MKIFLQILAMFFCIIISGLLIIFAIPGNELHYFSISVDKHRLLNSALETRLIIIGGSNVAFGIDSPRIEKALKRKVVNMGIHAGLGLHFMLNEVMPYIKNGDLILVMPEYEQLYHYFYGDGGATMAMLIANNPSALQYVASFEELKGLICNLPLLIDQKMVGLAYFVTKNVLKKPLPSVEGAIYTERAFNSNGDATGHLDHTFSPLDLERYRDSLRGNIDQRSIVFLNQFNENAVKKGAKVLFSFPAYPQSVWDAFNKEKMQDVFLQLRHKLHIDMINDPLSRVLPDYMIGDYQYHLNVQGREQSTDQIISGLAKYLQGLL